MSRPRFPALSLRASLLRNALLAAGVALLLASIGFVVVDIVSFRQGLVRRLAVEAEIVGGNSVAALLFEDRPAAAKILAGLAAQPHVIAAALYDRRGRLFASFVRRGAPLAEVPPFRPAGAAFPGDELLLSRVVTFDGGDVVGTVVIRSDLEELSDRLRGFGLIVALVSLASLAVSVLISARLQRAIAGPILSLAATARAVSVDENYSVRAEGGEGRGETALLIATFNEMLERIQRRESELLEARSELERRVAERTAELTRELAERRRTEAELRRNQELLAEAQAMAGAGSWEWDLASGETWWSDELRRLYGFERDETRPGLDAAAARLHPEDREAAVQAVRRSAESGEPYSGDRRVVLPDGRVRTFHADVRPVRDASGKVARVRGLEQDVTEQRRAEEERSRLVREQALREQAEEARRRDAFLARVSEALSSSLERERTLATAARLGVPDHADWAAVETLEPSGHLRRGAVAHARRPEAELAPLAGAALRPGSDAPGAVAIRLGRPVAAEPETRWQDAQQEALAASLGRGFLIAAPIVIQGEARGALLWCRAGRPFEPADGLLIEEVARRAAVALEHAMLYDEAQEANRLKDEFLATLSHELRTPLHAIVGWAHMLRTGSLDASRTRRAIESIDRNAQAQNQLISDVLDVSRIVAGKLRLNVVPVDARAVVEAALDTVRPAAEARRVHLGAELPGEPVTLAADADRLQQVVWNLLSNGIKFVPEGGAVSLAVTREGRHAAIRVTDDGPGIRPDFLPHVFERFRQADSSSTRPHGGLGLGLAIVRHLVELHGGTVEARNRADRSGAVFTVRLPLAPADAALARAGRGEPAHRSRSEEGALSGLCVLVVDDEPDAREMVAAALEMHGATVLAARGAEEALRLIREERPHVLLSDIEMPGVDGWELVRRIRALPREEGGSIPAAALTAYAGAEQRARALAAGYDAHIAKPVDPLDLLAAVESLAGRRAHVTRAVTRARILVVDDHPDVAESVQLLLSSPERQVVTAGDGESAIATAERFRPDLVLLDLDLPDMDGYEVARRLRELPGLAGVKLVALSGFGFPSDRERTREAGFARHLVKPVEPGALVALADALAPRREPAPN